MPSSSRCRIRRDDCWTIELASVWRSFCETSDDYDIFICHFIYLASWNGSKGSYSRCVDVDVVLGKQWNVKCCTTTTTSTTSKEQQELKLCLEAILCIIFGIFEHRLLGGAVSFMSDFYLSRCLTTAKYGLKFFVGFADYFRLQRRELLSRLSFSFPVVPFVPSLSPPERFSLYRKIVYVWLSDG